MLRLTRLKEARELAGLSQDELARASRTARATVADLELDKRTAQPRTARRLAEALGLEIRDLVEEPAGKVEAPSTSGPPYRKESIFDLVHELALKHDQQEQQAIARLNASEGRPQFYWMNHENEAIHRLLDRGLSEEVANALFALAMRSVRLEREKAHLEEENAQLRKRVREAAIGSK